MPIRLRLSSLLALDAATCAAMGILLLGAARPLAAATDIPAGLLTGAGALLLPIAVFMAILSRMNTVPRWGVNMVLLGNLGWVIASIALPLTGVISPNLIGWIALLGQAVAVAVLTGLERDAANAGRNAAQARMAA